MIMTQRRPSIAVSATFARLRCFSRAKCVSTERGEIKASAACVGNERPPLYDEKEAKMYRQPAGSAASLVASTVSVIRRGRAPLLPLSTFVVSHILRSLLLAGKKCVLSAYWLEATSTSEFVCALRWPKRAQSLTEQETGEQTGRDTMASASDFVTNN